MTELQEELRHQAYHDALTGLPNRVLFTDQVTETLAREQDGGTTHAVLFLDLDHFKNINDSWGHAAGDELLMQVADRLTGPDPAVRRGRPAGRRRVRPPAARTPTWPRRRTPRGESPTKLNTTFSVTGKEAKIHASIGIAVTGPHAATAEELIRNADIAMYTAKRKGHGRSALYEHALHSRLRQQGRLALELEHAVERRELVAHYQPVVSLVDGTIQAFEALVRWPHPERGLLAPSEFIDIAEESGLMFEVGRCVLAEAFQSARTWEETIPEAADIGIWVNLAPSELTNERLVEELALALRGTGLDPCRLTLEITESSMIRDEQGAVRAMQTAARARRPSLDRRLRNGLLVPQPARGVADRHAQDPEDVHRPARERRARTSSTRSCGWPARSTWSPSPRGSSTPPRRNELRELGCGLGQGYFFSKPIRAGDVVELLLRARQPDRPAVIAAA